jgi:hypothetical protein
LILLDENVPEGQRLALARWRPLKVGLDYAEKGVKDYEIVLKLRNERNLTFFTEDEDFFRYRGRKRRVRTARGLALARDKEKGDYGHPSYAIVVVETRIDRFAEAVDRFLRHRLFRAFARRKGHVFKLSDTKILCWRVADRFDFEVDW